MRLVVVTGVSGAGKSTALRALEDLGFYAVDNLPLPLVPELIDLLASRPDVDRAALGVDARSGNFLEGVSSVFADLRARGHSVEVLFLEATDEILIGQATYQFVRAGSSSGSIRFFSRTSPSRRWLSMRGTSQSRRNRRRT